MIRNAWMALIGFTFITILGCAREEKKREEKKRPAEGDVVSVLIYRPKAWHKGAAATLNVRLRIEGPSVKKAEILRDPEVPHDRPPVITITFLNDEEIVKVFDKVAMTPDC